MTIKECERLKQGNIITTDYGEFKDQPIMVEEVYFYKEHTKQAARIEAKVVKTGEPINVYYGHAILVDPYSVTLSEEECYCSIVKLYEKIAGEVLKKSVELGQFDCRKIRVTPGVIDGLYKYYEKEQKLTKYEVTTLLAIYGPKGNLEVSTNIPYAAKIEDGFYVEE